jgi:hypothetical protein
MFTAEFVFDQRAACFFLSPLFTSRCSLAGLRRKENKYYTFAYSAGRVVAIAKPGVSAVKKAFGF